MSPIDYNILLCLRLLMGFLATDRGVVQTKLILVFLRKCPERVLEPANFRPRMPRDINFTRVEIAALEGRHGSKLVLFTSTNRPSLRSESGRTRDRMSPQTPIPVAAWALIRTATGPSSSTSSARHVNFQLGWVPSEASGSLTLPRWGPKCVA